jgi:AraC-like DNA-binding protein
VVQEVPLSTISIDALLDRLDVRMDAFALCEIGDNCGLRVAPLDKIVVHYVLQGSGSIQCEFGTFPIQTGMVAVIPKKLPKRIDGNGSATIFYNAEESCPLVPGLVKYKACAEGPGLVLGCASVDANVGEGLGLFDHLQRPLVEKTNDPMLPLLFEAVLRELALPKIGAKTIVEAMMKQILVLLLRDHLKRGGVSSPLYLPLMDPQLGRALAAMLGKPQDAHSLDSLARMAGMSRSRFAHHFAATYGRSPIDYLHSVRLKAAARLLSNSATPVKSVAAAVGFASRSHFSRAFKREYGMDPSGFRKPSTEAGIDLRIE